MIAKGGTGSQCAASLRGRTELAHPTAARTGHGTQGAYTQQQHTKKEKKKTRDSPRVVDSVRGCSWRRGVSVRAV